MDETISQARRWHAAGWGILWLYPKAKNPIGGGWTTGPRKDWRTLERTYKAGFNVGVRLGGASRLDHGYLCCIDVDIKSADPKHRAEAETKLRNLWERAGALPGLAVLSGRGGGSAHYYYQSPEPFKGQDLAASSETIEALMPSKKISQADRAKLTKEQLDAGIRLTPAWGISFYSEGRQMVLPPSVHPDTGKKYAWKNPLVDSVALPLIYPERFHVSPDPRSGKGASPSRHLDAGRDVFKANVFNFTPEDVELDWYRISPEVKAAITSGTGVDDRSAYLMRAARALLSAGMTENQVLNVLTDPWLFLGEIGYDHAKTDQRGRAADWVYRYTLGKISAEREERIKVFKPITDTERVETYDHESEEPFLSAEPTASAARVALADSAFEDEVNYRQELDRGARGKVLPTLRNADLILTHEIEGIPFTKDLFANRISYGADTPWNRKAGQYLEDIDLTLVKRWFSDTDFGLEPPTNTILEVTALLAHRHSHHPVRDWLKSLQWDGKLRIGSWLKRYCQAKAVEPYLSEVSRKFLVAMVKRVFEPGCQWDYILVLQGDQGKMKSTMARALAGDRWFMDNLPDLKDKDAMLNLQGKWLIELGELNHVKRADYGLVKAYLIRRTDSVRAHYGRIAADVPRQSVFIGTVNEAEYLKDPTGNRRFWPVTVGQCDVDGLKRDRDQLFAEAYHVYQSGAEVLTLTKDGHAQAQAEQESRRIDDMDTELSEAFIVYLSTTEGKQLNLKSFHTAELFKGPGAPWAFWERVPYSTQTAAQVLRNLGFERRRSNGRRYWILHNPEMLEKARGSDPRVIPGQGQTPGMTLENGENDVPDFF